MAKYLTPKKAANILGVSVSSLRRWETEGQLKAIRTPGGQRRYLVKEIEETASLTKVVRIVLYARVSRDAQRDNLDKQIEFLRSNFPTGECISEIGSGLNFKRKKFLSILDRVLAGNIDKLVVAHPDRFIRFGFEVFKWLCEKHKCELLVFHENQFSPEQELIQDLLSIVHGFSTRLYGLQKYTKQVQQALQEDIPSCSSPNVEQDVTQQSPENQGAVL